MRAFIAFSSVLALESRQTTQDHALGYSTRKGLLVLRAYEDLTVFLIVLALESRQKTSGPDRAQIPAGSLRILWTRLDSLVIRDPVALKAAGPRNPPARWQSAKRLGRPGVREAISDAKVDYARVKTQDSAAECLPF